MREAEVGVIWETVASTTRRRKKLIQSKWLLVERTCNRFGIADPQDIKSMYEARIRMQLKIFPEERSAGEGRVALL